MTAISAARQHAAKTRSAVWAARAIRVLGLVGAAALAWGFADFAAQLDVRGAPSPPPQAEGIVALTGGPDRIMEALSLLAERRADRLLISGVNPATSMAMIERDAPGFPQLYDCCIDLGYAARNTLGNARETRAWARRRGISRSLIVVTSSYHMPRALMELQTAMPGVALTPYAVPDKLRPGPWWSSAANVRMALLEYSKYCVALARARLALQPAAESDPVFVGLHAHRG